MKKQSLLAKLNAANDFQGLDVILTHWSRGKYSKTNLLSFYNAFIHIIEGHVDWLERQRQEQPYDFFKSVVPVLQAAMTTLKERTKPNGLPDGFHEINIHLANQRVTLCMDLLMNEKHLRLVQKEKNNAVFERFCDVLRQDYIWESEWSHGVSFDAYFKAVLNLTGLLGQQLSPDILKMHALVQMMADWIKIKSDELNTERLHAMLDIVESVSLMFSSIGATIPLDLHSLELDLMTKSKDPLMTPRCVDVVSEMQRVLATDNTVTVESQLRAYHSLYFYLKAGADVNATLTTIKQFMHVYNACSDEELLFAYKYVAESMTHFESENEKHELNLGIEAASSVHGSLASFDDSLSSHSECSFEDLLPQSVTMPLVQNEIEIVQDNVEVNPTNDTKNSHNSSRPSAVNTPDEVSLPRMPVYRLRQNAQQSRILSILTDWDKTLFDRYDGKKDVFVNEGIFDLLAIAKALGMQVKIMTARSRAIDEGRRVKVLDSRNNKVVTISRAGLNTGIYSVLKRNGWSSVFDENSIIYCDLFKKVPGREVIYHDSFLMDEGKTKSHGFMSYSKAMGIAPVNIAVVDDDPGAIADIPGALKIIVPDDREKGDFVARKFKGFDEVLAILVQSVLYNDSYWLMNRLQAAHDLMVNHERFPHALRPIYKNDLIAFISYAKSQLASPGYSNEKINEGKRQAECSNESSGKRVKLDEAAPSKSSGSFGLFSRASGNSVELSKDDSRKQDKRSTKTSRV